MLLQVDLVSKTNRITLIAYSRRFRQRQAYLAYLTFNKTLFHRRDGAQKPAMAPAGGPTLRYCTPALARNAERYQVPPIVFIKCGIFIFAQERLHIGLRMAVGESCFTRPGGSFGVDGVIFRRESSLSW